MIIVGPFEAGEDPGPSQEFFMARAIFCSHIHQLEAHKDTQWARSYDATTDRPMQTFPRILTGYTGSVNKKGHFFADPGEARGLYSVVILLLFYPLCRHVY